jgi:hypothetical protein
MNRQTSSQGRRVVEPAGAGQTRRPLWLEERLQRLYQGSAFSQAVFPTPLGPLGEGAGDLIVPRFSCLSPRTSEESLRVAVYGGLEYQDRRSSEAVLHLLEQLLLEPGVSDGIFLSLVPLVDVFGAEHGLSGRALQTQPWSRSATPELRLLARDALQHAYHLMVLLETRLSTSLEDSLELVLEQADGSTAAQELAGHLVPADFAPFGPRVRVETVSRDIGVHSLGQDLGVAPVVLRFRLPEHWSVELSQVAVARIARRLILRYRGHQSFGQHI